MKTNFLLGGEWKIYAIRDLEHPDISDAECLDMRRKNEEFICPICRGSCERGYYKAEDKNEILGYENCVEHMESLDYNEYRKSK